MINENNISDYLAFINLVERNEFHGLTGLYYEAVGDFYKKSGNMTNAEYSYIRAISNYAKIKWYSASYNVAVKLENDDIAFVYADLANLQEKERKRQENKKRVRQRMTGMIEKWHSFLK
ncbi:MAG: hypothetical protein V1870_04825 [Candidatus Aenigmatarchaeota archaeon]